MGFNLFNRFKPISCRDAERALRNLGFVEEPKKSSSHRRWRLYRNERLFKVTLDCHRGEVKALNVKSMIKQAGVTAEEFYKAIESKVSLKESQTDN